MIFSNSSITFDAQMTENPNDRRSDEKTQVCNYRRLYVPESVYAHVHTHILYRIKYAVLRKINYEN